MSAPIVSPPVPIDKRGTIGEVFTGAKSLSSSPLGIIALFIVLIYGIAGLVFGVSVGSLGDYPKLILVWFLVAFPATVFLMFVYLVIFHYWKLYGPSDFADQKDFLAIFDRMRNAEKTLDFLAETSNVAVVDLGVKSLLPVTTTSSISGRAHILPAKTNSSDPQKGQWGGDRANKTRKITVGEITPLKRDRNFFRIPLSLESTDPVNDPVKGNVTFYLHPTFRSDVRVVEAAGGVATLELVAYGAFTVGVKTDDGNKLEIDLSAPDIKAPQQFKDN